MSERVLNTGRELIGFEDVDGWDALADGLAARGTGAAPSGSPASTHLARSIRRAEVPYASDLALLVQ